MVKKAEKYAELALNELHKSYLEFMSELSPLNSVPEEIKEITEFSELKGSVDLVTEKYNKLKEGLSECRIQGCNTSMYIECIVRTLAVIDYTRARASAFFSAGIRQNKKTI